MPNYWYSALTGKGAVEEGWMTASNEIAVEEQLRRRGSFLIRAEARSRGPRAADERLERRDLLALVEHLAGSLGAGIPLLSALDDAVLRSRSPGLQAVLAEVRSAVADDGMSLSDALAQHPKTFPELVVSSVRAGETTGQLAFTLRQLVDHLVWEAEISAPIRQVVASSVLTVISLGAFIAAVAGLMLPRIQAILRLSAQHMSTPARATFWLAVSIREHIAALAAVAVVIAAGVLLLRRTNRGRLLIDAAMVEVPLVGPLLLDVNMARAIARLGLFYRVGVDLLESLSLVQTATANSAVARVVRDAREGIATGDTLASAFARSTLVPDGVRRSLSLGESTGKLGEALDRAKLHYGREVTAAARRLNAVVLAATIAAAFGLMLFVLLWMIFPLVDTVAALATPR